MFVTVFTAPLSHFALILWRPSAAKVPITVAGLAEQAPALAFQCMHGDCYRFAKYLQGEFGGTLAMNAARDHVGLKVGTDIYDIRGKLGRKSSCEFHDMTGTEERTASKWRCNAGFCNALDGILSEGALRQSSGTAGEYSHP